MNKLTLLSAASLIVVSSVAYSSESSHFKGKKVETLQQAVDVFSNENKAFAAIINDGKVDMQEMGKVHQMTYSMENALRKIKREVAEMEELLEEVHEASEHGGNKTVIEDGRKYLDKAQVLVP